MIEEQLKEAISKRKAVELTYCYGLNPKDKTKEGTISIIFHPYIYGSDLMQYDFVYGFLPENPQYYKFLIHFIQKVKILSDDFEINQSESIPLFSTDDELYFFAQGTDMFSSYKVSK